MLQVGGRIFPREYTIHSLWIDLNVACLDVTRDIPPLLMCFKDWIGYTCNISRPEIRSKYIIIKQHRFLYGGPIHTRKESRAVQCCNMDTLLSPVREEVGTSKEMLLNTFHQPSKSLVTILTVASTQPQMSSALPSPTNSTLQ